MRHGDTALGAPAIEDSDKWFVSKKIDLLFVCGIAPWILGMIAYFIVSGLNGDFQSGFQSKLLTIFILATSFVIGESHQFISLIRYYSKKFRERRNAYIWRRVPIWAIYGLAVGILFQSIPLGSIFCSFSSYLYGIFAYYVREVLLMLFPVFLAHHLCSQALAVGLKYCQKQNHYLSGNELVALNLVSWLCVAVGSVTIAVPFDMGAYFGQKCMRIFDTVALMLSDIVLATAVMVLALVTHFLIKGVKNNEWLPVGATLTWLTVVVLMLLPLDQLRYVWIFMPVFFHASQSWILAWSAEQREVIEPRGRMEHDSSRTKTQKFSY
ncbi:MAG: hypothetical protein SGJ27_15130 [Candidatus Melainabacteria bacterium]|nr:hypothetical protein [Candidatus Melainabacteria bacterium]